MIQVLFLAIALVASIALQGTVEEILGLHNNILVGIVIFFAVYFILANTLNRFLKNQSSRGVEPRGNQPQSGERTMTRKEWKAKQREKRVQRKKNSQ